LDKSKENLVIQEVESSTLEVVVEVDRHREDAAFSMIILVHSIVMRLEERACRYKEEVGGVKETH